MKAIKWTGPKTYGNSGIIMPGDILTEDKVSVAIMETWVNQDMAEWEVDLPAVPLHTGPEKTVSKKSKIREA